MLIKEAPQNLCRKRSHRLCRFMENCSSMATPEVTLKLLIDIKNHKVLFAEAGKDFVDFLFKLMALPLGAVTALLEINSMVGCLGDLYESIQNLSQTFFQEGKDKDSVLKPTFRTNETPLLLPNSESFSPNVKVCSSIRMLEKNAPSTFLPSCHKKMSLPVDYGSIGAKINKTKRDAAEGGFVKGAVTYMVMDNLEVTPMSTITSISLLKKFNIKVLDAVKEKVVTFGMTEGLELLKASLQTKSALTDIFLVKKDCQVSGRVKRNKGA